MNNKKNELQLVDNTFKKRMTRIIGLVVEVLLIIGAINILSEWSTRSKDSLITNCITLGLTFIYTLFIIRKVFYKKGRKSMTVMKNFCSYNELNNLLENESFKELKPCGADAAEASKLWLKLDGVFIPKNFIVGAYIEVATYGVFELRIILINGKMIYHRLGSDKSMIEGPVNAIKSAVPNMKIYTDVFGKNKDIFSKIEAVYKEKSKDGIDVQALISKWTGEFEIK